MATTSNALFIASRRSHSLGLLAAGGILFVICFGGMGALWSAYSGAISTAPAIVANLAA
ncbi:MAG TPA: hypothetical protein VK454_06140 [Myxococcaceae bacterium]|nr:hypothetical protein [Myxococcaceae bacterium]